MYIRGMMMAMSQWHMSVDMAVLSGKGIGVGMAVMRILMGVAMIMSDGGVLVEMGMILTGGQISPGDHNA